MGVAIKPQFLAPGRPLLKRLGVPAMDPRCCCAPFATTCDTEYFHQDYDALPRPDPFAFHFRDLQVWFNNRGNLASWPPTNVDPLLDYWWTAIGVHRLTGGPVDIPYDGSGFAGPGVQTVRGAQDIDGDFEIVGGSQGFRYGNVLSSARIGARIESTVRLTSTARIPAMPVGQSADQFISVGPVGPFGSQSVSVRALRRHPITGPDFVAVAMPGMPQAILPFSDTISLEVTHSEERITLDGSRFRTRITAQGTTYVDDTTEFTTGGGPLLQYCGTDVEAGALPFTDWGVFLGEFAASSSVSVTYNNVP